jgi:hypothetical protein
MGHLRPIDDVRAMSAFPPIATKLLNCSRGEMGHFPTSATEQSVEFLRLDAVAALLHRNSVKSGQDC